MSGSTTSGMTFAVDPRSGFSLKLALRCPPSHSPPLDLHMLQWTQACEECEELGDDGAADDLALSNLEKNPVGLNSSTFPRTHYLIPDTNVFLHNVSAPSPSLFFLSLIPHAPLSLSSFYVCPISRCWKSTSFPPLRLTLWSIPRSPMSS